MTMKLSEVKALLVTGEKRFFVTACRFQKNIFFLISTVGKLIYVSSHMNTTVVTVQKKQKSPC